MNCREWEERIALYAGGDLAAAEAAAVERHLGECAGCQVFASGMRESLRVMRDAHAEELDGAAFAAVRARVLGELNPRVWWRRGWVWGLAGTALMVVLVLWPRAAVVRRAPATVAVQPAVESPAPGPVLRNGGPLRISRPAHMTRRRVHPVRAVAAKVAGPPIVVKMITDDPDVVIYWITDTRGE
jgi:hypothetical protein